MRYYVGCSEPSNKLQQIVEFVMKGYFQMWFTIKSKPSCTEGARHLWQTIHLLRYASSEIKAIVYPVIQRNGFFGHPENLLLSMISDSRPHVRKLGLLRIMKARSLIKANIRQFSIPEINFEATDYIELIDWQKCKLTEPPITTCISDEFLTEMVTNCHVPEVQRLSMSYSRSRKMHQTRY